ncbi:hypothetical protein [Microbulbifer sp. YPW1]|nr:hypothetical protein [Microbulbifer sp. YPW1]QKX17655.1 hypothetical protein HUW35_12035 [Microbulbifer sp. YPW1]
MNLIKRWWNKRRKLRKIRTVFVFKLKGEYGKSRNLKFNQVKSALAAAGLEGEHEEYAYALALSPAQYKYYQKLSSIEFSQEALRIDLGVSSALLGMGSQGAGPWSE